MWLRAGLCLFLSVLAVNTSYAQLPLRGHAHTRDGLFHTSRVRWGGGLTPQGAAFLTSAADAFAPIVGGFVGRELVLVDSSNRDFDTRDQQRSRDFDNERTRDFRSTEVYAEFAEQQRQANILLARTARLVNVDITGTGFPTPVSEGRLNPPGVGNNSGLEDIGKDPWKDRP